MNVCVYMHMHNNTFIGSSQEHLGQKEKRTLTLKKVFKIKIQKTWARTEVWPPTGCLIYMNHFPSSCQRFLICKIGNIPFSQGCADYKKTNKEKSCHKVRISVSTLCLPFSHSFHGYLFSTFQMEGAVLDPGDPAEQRTKPLPICWSSIYLSWDSSNIMIGCWPVRWLCCCGYLTGGHLGDRSSWSMCLPPPTRPAQACPHGGGRFQEH